MVQAPPVAVPGSRLVTSHDVAARSGYGLALPAGSVLRIVESEGPQVVDCAILAVDTRHPLHLGQSIALDLLRRDGGPRALRGLRTSPPDEVELATVVEDTVADHCTWLGSRCSRTTHLAKAARGLISDEAARTEPTCQDNIDGAFADLGVLEPYRGDVLNLFMRVDERAAFSGRGLVFLQPASEVGSSWAMVARHDLFVGLSACPNEDSPLNGGTAKGFTAQVWS